MQELTGGNKTTAAAGSSALAELAVMKAKGQISDEQFEAAKSAILNEGGKTVYRAATPPAEKFVCTETTTTRGSGIGAAIIIYLVGMVLMFATMAIARGTISVIIGGGATIYAFYLMFAGVKNGRREGPCPHCGSTLTVQNREEAARSCRSCKHRIVLRGGKLSDVTPA
ncbi:SHOCT domain-containing protein [Rhizobium sp.]